MPNPALDQYGDSINTDKNIAERVIKNKGKDPRRDELQKTIEGHWESLLKVKNLPPEAQEKIRERIHNAVKTFHAFGYFANVHIDENTDPITTLLTINHEVQALMDKETDSEKMNPKILEAIAETKRSIAHMIKDIIIAERIDEVVDENNGKELEHVVERMLHLMQNECLGNAKNLKFLLINEKNRNGRIAKLTQIEHGIPISDSDMERKVWEADKAHLSLFEPGEKIIYDPAKNRLFVKVQPKGQLLGIVEIDLKPEKELSETELKELQVILKRMGGEIDQAMPKKRIDFTAKIGKNILTKYGTTDNNYKFKEGIAEFMEMVCLASKGAFSAELMVDVAGDGKTWFSYSFNDDGQMKSIEMDPTRISMLKKPSSERKVDEKNAMICDITDGTIDPDTGAPKIIGKIIFKTATTDGANELTNEDRALQQFCADMLSGHILRWREALKLRTEGFDPLIARAMMSDEGIETDINEKLSVSFVDIAGFTAISEILKNLKNKGLEKKTLRRLVVNFLRMVQQVTHRYGGIWDKGEGDKGMTLFGVPLIKQKNVDGYIEAIRTGKEEKIGDVQLQHTEYEVKGSTKAAYICAKCTTPGEIKSDKDVPDGREQAEATARRFLLEKYPDIGDNINMLIDVEKGVEFTKGVEGVNKNYHKVFIRMPLPGTKEFESRKKGTWTEEDKHARAEIEDDNIDPLGNNKLNRRPEFFAMNALKAAIMMRHKVAEVAAEFETDLIDIACAQYGVAKENLTPKLKKRLLKELQREKRLRSDLATTTGTFTGDMLFTQLDLAWAYDLTALGDGVNTGARIQGGKTKKNEIRIPMEQYHLVKALIENNTRVPTNANDPGETWTEFLESLGMDPAKTTIAFSEHYEGGHKNKMNAIPTFGVDLKENKLNQIQPNAELTRDQLLAFQGEEFGIIERFVEGKNTRLKLKTITSNPAESVIFYAVIPNWALDEKYVRFASPGVLTARTNASAHKTLTIQGNNLAQFTWESIATAHQGEMTKLNNELAEGEIIENITRIPMGCYRFVGAVAAEPEKDDEEETRFKTTPNSILTMTHDGKPFEGKTFNVTVNQENIFRGGGAVMEILNNTDELYDFQSYYETIRPFLNNDSDQIVFASNLRFYVLTKEQAEHSLANIITRETIGSAKPVAIKPTAVPLSVEERSEVLRKTAAKGKHKTDFWTVAA